MRLSKERVRHMAQAVAGRLRQEGYLETVGDDKSLIEALERAITDELSVEDRLNAEVRAMLKMYERQIEQGQVDYQKMFQLIKQKLIRERGLIL
ncbi:MAG: DUF507 family protein [Nitrospira sp.]|nr:DUF507 family protein [Nitrospira sp.]MCP9441099.1 DUF507 family protein [Nitrospira sp.]